MLLTSYYKLPVRIEKQNQDNVRTRGRVGSNSTAAKFSLARGDSQISFNKGVNPGDLVYRQCCLLPAPYQLIKNTFEYSRLASSLVPRLATLTSICGVRVHSTFNGLIFKLSKISLILNERVRGTSGLISKFSSWKRAFCLAFSCGNKDVVISLKV